MDSPLAGIASDSLSIGPDLRAASRNYMMPFTGRKFLISGLIVAPISAGVLSFGGYPADLEANTLTIRIASPSTKLASTRYDFRYEDQSSKESSAVAQVFMDPIYEVLGSHGVSRLDEFRHYCQGWDNGKGTALSPASEKRFTTFLRKFASELGKVRPSVFLTREGNLQLGWEDKSSKAVEVEFLPDHIEVFIESSNEEGTLRIEDAKKLFQNT